jgi:histidine ammonia-lyase
MSKQTVTFGNGELTIEDILDLASRKKLPALSSDPEFINRIESGWKFLEKLLKEDGVIYGVTTGYGDSCTVTVPTSLAYELPVHLTRFHGCGLGEYFDEQQSFGIVATRIASLARGYSGVRKELLEQLVLLLKEGIAPLIPQEGSVGASGDLTPLSYVAATLIGERDVIYKGEVCSAKDIYTRLNISPIELMPKEGLAIMNGTAVMTALACFAYSRAEYLTRLTSRITSLVLLATQGNGAHFDDLLFQVKPHQGQQQIAKWIQSDINYYEHPRNSARLQDRYSIRCAPHIIGVLRDALGWMRRDIENELNSANDNPIIDGEGEHVLHGGHFYGGHIAFVMDSMKNCIANLADLMDRQMALLVDPKFNHGLTRNLSGASGERLSLNHGFKAVQIGVSAWTAEALKNTMPASVFSRSTESHNQDKVSMGTIAARDCLRVLQLTEQVASAVLLAAVQGLKIRIKSGEVKDETLTDQVRDTVRFVHKDFAFLLEDRPLERELRLFTDHIQQQKMELYNQL